MLPPMTNMLAGPWAVLPDRLPFIRAALNGVSMREQRASPQALIGTNTKLAGRKADNGAVAVLPFYGIAVQRTDALGEAIGLLSLRHFTQAFRAALADDSIDGLVLDIDCPGGSVYGVMELADEISRARARKPIAAVANSLAAAGAFWIASAAREFFVTPGGEVGGIGIHDMHTDLSKALEKAGVKTTLIAAGRYMIEGNPFQPLSTSGCSAMQSRVDNYYRAFVAAVAKHRNVPEPAVRNGMGQGRLLDAERAKGEDMVDGIATLDDVVRRLAHRIGQGKITNASRVAATRQREIDALARPPSCGPSREMVVTCAAARQRLIALLSV